MKHLRFFYILLLFIDINASENIIDSTIVKHEPALLTNDSSDLYLKIFSKGGERGIESTVEFKLSKNILYYKGYLFKGALKSDSLRSSFEQLILNIKNYKTEYDYYGCSQWLDGYRYLIELWDNTDKSITSIVSGDYSMCYFNLCTIFSNIDDIIGEFEGESYKKYLKIMRQGNPPCSKILEENRK